MLEKADLGFNTRKLKYSIGKINKKVKSFEDNSINLTVYGVTKNEGITITGNEASFDLSEYIVISENMFAYNPYRVNIGSIGLTPKGINGIVSPAYVVFKVKKDINPEFLLRYLKSKIGLQLINLYGNRGGVRNALRFEDLGEIDFPDLTINEQNEAIKKLKKIDSDFIKLQTEIEYQKSFIKKLRQAILQKAIQGKLVPQNPKDEPVSEFLATIKSERRKTKINNEIKNHILLSKINEDEKMFDIPYNWSWIRIIEIGIINPRNNNISDDKKVSFIPMKYISEKYNVKPIFEEKTWGEVKTGFTHFQNNDVVIAKITPCFENSKCAVMKNLVNGFGAGTTELHVFRTINKIIEPEFLYIFFKTPLFLNSGEKKMTGSAGQKRVPKEFIEQYPIPLPPLAEQKRIVKKVDNLMKLCNDLEKQVEESKINAEKLMQSVLQESFSKKKKNK